MRSVSWDQTQSHDAASCFEFHCAQTAVIAENYSTRYLVSGALRTDLRFAPQRGRSIQCEECARLSLASLNARLMSYCCYLLYPNGSLEAGVVANCRNTTILHLYHLYRQHLQYNPKHTTQYGPQDSHCPVNSIGGLCTARRRMCPDHGAGCGLAAR